MRKLTFLGLLFVLMTFIPIQNALADYCTYSGYKNNSERNLNSFTLTDGTNSATVSNIQRSYGAVYVDKTSSVFTTTAGATLQFSELDWPGAWMHGYVYIDYNNDQTFSTELNADGTTGGELVSYSFYSPLTGDAAANGENSKGEAKTNGLGIVGQMPSWTLPSDLAAGDYRLRFKIDWNSLNPCGETTGENITSNNGGCLCDITIRIEGEVPEPATYTVTVAASEGGSAIASATEVEENATVTLTATAAEGFEFVNWTVDGVEVSTANPYEATITANTEFVANFQEIEEPEIDPVSGTLDLSFTKVDANNATVAIEATGVEVGGITSAITSNNPWKSLTADNATFPNASIVCPDKNTSLMTSGNEGTITITLNNVPEGYSFKNVTFTSAAINGAGEFQGDAENAQHVNFTLKQGDVVLGTVENVAIKVNSNGGESVVVPFEISEAFTATEGRVELTLVLSVTESKGCFYGLVGVSIDTEVASTPEPAVTYTVTTSVNDEAMGTATADPAGDVEEGTEVTFTATANEGYEFDSWFVTIEGENASQITENPYTTAITANSEFVAHFKAEEPEEWPATVALIETANALIAEEGVGFPNAEAKATFQAVIDEATATPTEAMLTPLQDAINAYYATDAITQPTAGEVYAFISEGYYSNYYMYNNAGTLALAAYDDTTVLPESAYFVCEYDEESGKYQFKTIDGAYYLAYPSPGKTWLSGRSETGLETTSSRLTQFEIGTLTVSGVADQYLFGFVHLWGYRGYEVKDGVSSDFVGPMVVKSDGTFDGGAGDFYTYGSSSAFSVVEVEYEVLEPAIVVTAPVGVERQFSFEVANADTKLLIDWGDGTLVETETIAVSDPNPSWIPWIPTSVNGTPVGEGIVKIYGDGITVFDCSYSASYASKITSIDVTNASDLLVLYAGANEFTTLDLSANTALIKTNIIGNANLTSLDLSSNTALTKFDANECGFTSIDLSNNTALDYVSLNNTPIGSIDVSSNTALTSLYLQNCGLTELNVSANTGLKTLSVNNNSGLTSLDVSSVTAKLTLHANNCGLNNLVLASNMSRINIQNNNFTLATLPVSTISNYNYAPQKAMAIAEVIEAGESIDLSAQTNIQGVADAPQATTFAWITAAGDSLVAGTDYTETEGVFTFNVAADVQAYCSMTTAAFPKFSGAGAFMTDTTTIKAITAPATYTVTVSASEGGSATISATEVVENGTVTLTATANEGYDFINWTVGGVEVSTANPYEATVTAATDYVANFQVEAEKLQIVDANATLSHYSIWGGESYPVSNIYDGSYSTKYWAGTNQYNGVVVGVTLAEESNIGKINLYMASGDRPNEAKIQVSSDNATWADVATFTNEDIVAEGGNYVFTCNAQGAKGKYVRMYITNANSGSWLQVVELEAYEAIFDIAERTITVSANDAAMGSAYIGTEGVTETTSDQPVAITAVAAEGYRFVNWTIEGTEVSTVNPYTDTTDGDKAYVANFEVIPTFAITTSVNDAAMGTATATPSEVREGESAVLEATANAGYRFVSWTFNGTVVSTRTPYTTAAISADAEYIATFEAYSAAAEELPTGYPVINKKLQESGAETTLDNVHSHALQGFTISVDGAEVLSQGTTTTTFNNLTSSKSFDAYKGQTIVINFTNGTWSTNVWACFDWNRDGRFDQIVAAYPESGRTGGNNDEGSITVEVPENIQLGKSVLRIISDGIVYAPSWDVSSPDYGTHGEGKMGYAGSLHDITLNAVTPPVPTYTIAVSVNDATMGSATTSADVVEEGTTATLTATAAEGFEFVNWTLDEVEVSTEAVYTTTEVMENREYVANFKFTILTPREVSVATNNVEKGYAAIVSPAPEGTATSVTTGDMVTVEAFANGTDNFFVNWTIDGEVVGTESTYTYLGAEAATIQANFVTKYVVTINQVAGGEITVTVDDVEIESGDRVAEGDMIVITAVGEGTNWVKELLLDGSNVMPTEQEESYSVAGIMDAAVTISAVFENPTVYVTYEFSGNGYIEVWSSDSFFEGDEETTPVTPAGVKYGSGDVVTDGKVAIFVFPGSGDQLESLTVNGEEQDLTEEGVLFEFGDIPFEDIVAPIHIVAEFSGTSTGINTADADATNIYAIAEGIVVEAADVTTVQVYTIAGTLVSEQMVSEKTTIAVNKGVYIVKAGNKVSKVVVK